MADKIVPQDEPGAYGYGTKAAFESLLKRLESHQLPTTGLVLINIDTLVRNATNPDWKIDKIVEEVAGYMSNISNDYATCVIKWRAQKHHIVFYHADYPAMVSPMLRRVHAGPTAMLAKESLAKLLERLKHITPQTIDNVTSMIALSKDIKQPSWKGLAQLCDKLAAPAVTVHMISHNPVDWHITKFGRPGLLYRSHTGAVVKMTPNDLGPIVFDVKGVPFYPITHVVLGDKTMIKGIVNKQSREQFIQMALRDRFVLRPESFILNHVFVKKSFIPYRLD